MAKAGRKNKYHTHIAKNLGYIKSMCREGLIEEEICKRLGVSVSTFNKYKTEFPELMASIKEGKEIPDYNVTDSLYKRAMGYEYKEITRERVTRIVHVPEKTMDGQVIEPATEKREHELVVTKEVTKVLPPDVAAIIFWLKNRRSDLWKDKHDLDHHNLDPFEGMGIEEVNESVRELETTIREIAKKAGETIKI